MIPTKLTINFANDCVPTIGDLEELTKELRRLQLKFPFIHSWDTSIEIAKGGTKSKCFTCNQIDDLVITKDGWKCRSCHLDDDKPARD